MGRGRRIAWRAVLAACAAWGAVGERAAAQAGGAGEVTLAIDAIGVGGGARAGDWVGVRVRVTDSSPRQREVLVALDLIDADGDRPAYQSVMTTNPGVAQPVWLYARLPSWFRQNDRLSVTASAAVEIEDADAREGELGFTRGRLLGTAEVPAGNVIPSRHGVIGVVGRARAGLGAYTLRSTGEPWCPTGHEVTELVGGFAVEELPDRWMGLSIFDALVWTDELPWKLRAEQAAAMREWISRGGHLVVVLPSVGQAWLGQAGNPLADLMPAVSVERQEGVDLTPYRALLTRSGEAPLPGNATVHLMRPLPEANAGEAVRVLDAPGGGEGVVMRRLFGTGAVSVIGVDVAARAFEAAGLPDADVFWHRVLGRRGDLPTQAELAAIGQRGVVVRKEVELDQDIPVLIAKTGRAAAGVLLGFTVFVAYWLLAGPVGNAVLRRRGLTRHAWVWFVAMTGVFTVLAWGGARLIRPSRVEGTHVTFLHHVYGQPVQRARSWMSLLLPEYGEMRIGVGEPGDVSDADGEGPRNVVSPWEPASSTGPGGGAFPDTRAYAVNARSPRALAVPSRATVKQVRIDWSGGPRWRMPMPVGVDGAEGAGALPRLQPDGRMSGRLRHELPGAMEEVVVIVNRGQTVLRSGRGGPLLVDASAYKVAGAWAPGAELDLAAVTQAGRAGTALEEYVRGLLPRVSTFAAVADEAMPDVRSAPTRFMALALYAVLSPPDYQNPQSATVEPAAMRSETHGWDLGLSFTTPALMIVGHVGLSAPAESPVPMTVDGKRAPTSGRTVVLWVYHLPDRPPRYPGDGGGG